MAPRRNNNTHSGVDVHNLLTLNDHQDQNYDMNASTSAMTNTLANQSFNGSGHQQNNNSLSSTSSSPLSYNGNGSGGGVHHHHNHNLHNQHQQQSFSNGNGNVGNQMNQMNQQIASENFTRCCVPTGDCFKANTAPDFGLINLDHLNDCVRVICNNENCSVGQYMHRECFDNWEQGVLTSLRSIGRARSWSDRQRAQNLWTKKGYDLVYRACGCKCGRGHMKKDLDWIPPANNVYGRCDEEANKKKKKRNRNNQKPTLAMASINPGSYHPNSQQLNGNNGGMINTAVGSGATSSELNRVRTGSLSSSSNGSTSPPVSNSSELSISPIHSNNNIIPGKKQQNNSGNANSMQQQQSPQTSQSQQQNKSKVEIYSERVRSTSGCNGIFSRRLDFSTFNMLPMTRLNSYQVKMEDEGNHGNDDTRLFILSSLAQNQKSRVSCILCEEPMLVFDRYPLVDGTFFLSPKQHAPGCTEVKYEETTLYLTAVCMGCLDGKNGRAIYCRFCRKKWDGTALVLGTMYSYDIFAAKPCCPERKKCNACFKFLLHPNQSLNFFSDYSHSVTCPYCTTYDAHFIKPLSYCYTHEDRPIASSST